MDAPAQQAGPGPRREGDLPSGSEAAGPAGPRLIIKEVVVRVGPKSAQARATLALGTRLFTGTVEDGAGLTGTWQLAAAASVVALQQYLQQCATDPPTPQIQLLDTAATTTGIGQEIVQVAVRLSHGSNQIDLLGSALVRNDRCSTAVAAALDATARCLGRFGPPVAARAEACTTALTRPSPATEVETHPDAAPSSTSPNAPAGDAASRVSPRAGGEPDEERREAVASAADCPALGVVISPTSIRAAAVDASGKLLAEARRPSPPSAEPEATLARAREAVREAAAGVNCRPRRFSALGLAVPGRLDAREGICISSGDFPSWREVAVTDSFAAEFALPVSLIGPTQAAAFAELAFGAARGLADLVFVRVGADIDVAVVAEGRPLFLSRDGAPLAGHMVIEADGPRCACGENGCWQTLANREALVTRAVRALRAGAFSTLGAAVDNRFGALTPTLVVRLAAAGDAVARRAVDETGRYLAVGLANLITLFSPEAVIVECSPPPISSALLHAAAAGLKASPRAQSLAHCVVLAPELGDAGPVIGAAAWAARRAA